jgi:hypothetical protein
MLNQMLDSTVENLVHLYLNQVIPLEDVVNHVVLTGAGTT